MNASNIRLQSAYNRLNRAISETSGKQRNFISSHARNREINSSLQRIPKKKSKSNYFQSIDHDNHNEQMMSLPDTLIVQQEAQVIQMTKTSLTNYACVDTQLKKGSVTESMKQVFALHAHNRNFFCQNIQVKRFQQIKTQTNLDQLTPDKVKKVLQKTEFIHKINVQTLLDLFQAKCQDNHILYVPSQAIKFIERFRRLCSKGNMLLSNLFLGPISASVLNKILQQYDFLIILDLSHNPFTEKGFALIANGLHSNQGIIHLSLSNCNISFRGIEVIVKNVPNTLISIDLSFNRITNQGMIYIKEFLYSHRILQILILEEVGSTVNFLSDGISQSESLCVLNIKGNQLKDSYSSLLISIPVAECMQDINLSCTSIGDRGIQIISASIKKNYKQRTGMIKKLNFDRCNITVLGLLSLLEVLPLTYIESLILSRNDFENLSFLKVIGQLFFCHYLYELSLVECNLNSYSSVGLAEMQRCKSLRKLNISLNNFTDENSAGFISGLVYIEQLNISKCRLGNRGATILMQNLQANNYLEDLNISENMLTEDIFDQLGDILKTNSKLLKIDFSFNLYTHIQVADIEARLCRNQIKIKQTNIPKIKQQYKELKQLVTNTQLSLIEKQGEKVNNFPIQSEMGREQNSQFYNFRILDNESNELVVKKEKAQESLKTEIKNQQIYIEKERNKTEKIREKKDQMIKELIDLNNQYVDLMHAFKNDLIDVDDEIQKQVTIQKQIDTQTKEFQKKLKNNEEKSKILKMKYEKQLNSITFNHQIVSRKYYQTISVQTQIDQVAQIELDEQNAQQKLSQSPKKNMKKISPNKVSPMKK